MRPVRDDLRVTITRLRANTILDNNSPRYDWTDPNKEPIEGALVQASETGDDDLSRGEDRSVAYRIQVPTGTDVQATDRFEIPGQGSRQFRVVGEPQTYPSRIPAIAYLGFVVEHRNGERP